MADRQPQARVCFFPEALTVTAPLPSVRPVRATPDGIEPAHHCIDERGLEIEARLLAWIPVLTEPLEHGGDVLMLVVDRSAGPVDHRLQ